MDTQKILSQVNSVIGDYENKSVEIVDGLLYNQYQTLKKIEYYWNSRYTNGQTDEFGRIKPFYNISKFRVNVATRATDLDIKDIKVFSENSENKFRTIILSHELRNWFKQNNISKLLNDFTKTRAKYGGVLIKKTKVNGNLNIELVDWKNVITDTTDVLGGAIAEIHYMSPVELSKKKGIWDNIDEAITLATKSRKKNAGFSGGNTKKVAVYEIYGEFSEDSFKEDGDPNVYIKKMFIVAGSPSEKQVVLYQEDIKEIPYKYLAWDYVSGRALGIGIVEDGFEAQMWTNDSVIAEKNIMDLAGKVFIKTNSKELGNNAISDMENGMVIQMGDGEDASLLNLMPNSLPQFNNLITRWDTQYERATNTFESVTGETMPSGTPLGSVAIQSAQASSFFDYRREESGIFWVDVIMTWVLPYLIKKINKKHILASEFSGAELTLIDDSFSAYQANQTIKKRILEGEGVSAEDYTALVEGYREFLQQDGNRRFLDIPDNYFKDFENKVYVDITGESRSRITELQSLERVLGQVASNPQILIDPNLKRIFDEILNLSGLSVMTQMPQQQTTQQNTPSPIQPALERQTESVLPDAQKQ